MITLGRKPKPSQEMNSGAKAIFGTISRLTKNGIEGLAQHAREGDGQRQRHADRHGDQEADHGLAAGDQVYSASRGRLRQSW